jgi:hypothetical protein
MIVSKKIPAPIDLVWDIITDTEKWAEWGPSVTEVACPDRWISLAMKGRVRTALGIWLPFEITEFNAPNYWGWTVAGIQATGHGLEVIDDNACLLRFEIPYGLFPYKLVCQLAIKKISLLAQSSLIQNLNEDVLQG